VKARRGERALEKTLALGADKLLLGAEVLDSFNAKTALGTAIGIQRHRYFLCVANHPLSLLYRQEAIGAASFRFRER